MNATEKDEHKYTNRLINESSPYLLQHAHNPVDWRPWGEEAFSVAKEKNLPVLLSVGYSTCHWCHVMEEESFEDEEIARFINENYIPIKVDREERPDIDSVYMSAVQALTGRGGWPMTVWLTPDGKPFFGGSYYPARDGERGVAMGFLTLLKKLIEVYRLKEDKVKEAGLEVAEVVKKSLSPREGVGFPGPNHLKMAIKEYKMAYDPENGGIRGAPKFPSSLPVRLLLRLHRRTGDEKLLQMSTETLQKMARGGMYDHVGGGFHRYSTDEMWLVPHFEKMLYDNALLVMAYLEGFQATGNPEFEAVAREILEYVEREMTSPEGAFYSATDADSLTPESKMEEGAFFVWSRDELEDALGDAHSRIISACYGVGPTPNFEGRYILSLTQSLETAASSLSIPPDELKEIVKESKKTLYEYRKRRRPPFRDEKILASWNGLMISAFARAGLALRSPEYVQMASRAAEFIFESMFKDNRLHRIYKDGRAKQIGYLDDYAFLTAALLDLYEASHDGRWLKKAVLLDEILEEGYEDMEKGGFFMTGKDHEKLLAREKPHYDGAEPSGNSIAILNLLRLGAFTLKESYEKRGEKALTAFMNDNKSSSLALSEMLTALDFFLDKPKEIVILYKEGNFDAANPFMEEFARRFIPNRTLTVTPTGKELEEIEQLNPGARGKSLQGKEVCAFVCEKGVCSLPSESTEEFLEKLNYVEKL